MWTRKLGKLLLCAALAACEMTFAQNYYSGTAGSDLQLRIVSSKPGKPNSVPAVVWLEPISRTQALPFLPHGRYTLLQKNRTFTPHLLVIPAGSVVQFPNADPFYHNVFSLFDGKRFDLGLYEAGSSKSVTFSRPGVSYIFCNIHPEMSAVVIALTTPLYAIADADDAFLLHNVPSGDYQLHFWIEGVPQSVLGGLDRPVHVSSEPLNLGEIKAPINHFNPAAHKNMFGKSYDADTASTY